MTAHNRDRIPAQAAVRLRELPALVAAERARRGLSQRQAAAALDLSPSTIGRVEKGQMPDVSAFLAIAGWLRLPLGWFTGEMDPQDAYRRGWDDCAAGVRAAIDTAGPAKEDSRG